MSTVPKKANACDMRTCFLCRMCLEEWGPAISTHRKNYTYKRGETIFTEGERVDGMYFVYSGIVKVHKKWDLDKELIIRFATEGEVLGHRGLGQEADAVYPVSATAMDAVMVCFVDLDFFQASLRMNYPLIHQLLYFYAAELQESERKMRDLAHMQVKGRVAHALLSLQDKFGCTEAGFIDFTMSRQELASFTGATYETVFRIMNELLKEQLISVSGKDINILDPVRLGYLTKEAAAAVPLGS